MKKVLMIVMNDFKNESRVEKEANSLGNQGYVVKVLALDDGVTSREEKFTCFQLVRIKLKSRDKLSKTNRLIQLIKYYEFYSKCRRYALEFRPDVVHIHDVAPLPIGVAIKKKLGCQLIYDSHELWSSVNGRDDNPTIINIARDLYEKWAAPKADAVITVSGSIVAHLTKYLNLDKEIVEIRNLPMEVNEGLSSKYFHDYFQIESSKRIVLYQGFVAKGRGVEELIDSLKLLDENIVLVVLGDGSYKKLLLNKVETLNLSNRVFFHDAVKYDELLNYTACADLGICMIQKVSLSDYYSLPNKLFEYIQAGIPVICSNFPDMKKLVDDYGVGETCNPTDSAQLSRCIEFILQSNQTSDKYRQNCRKARKLLNWSVEEKKLIALYNKL